MNRTSLFFLSLLLAFQQTSSVSNCHATGFIERMKEMVGGTTQPGTDYSIDKEINECYRKIEKRAEVISEKANEARGFTSHITNELKDFNEHEEKRIEEIKSELAGLTKDCDELDRKIASSKYFAQYKLPTGTIKRSGIKEAYSGKECYEVEMAFPGFEKQEINVRVIAGENGEANQLFIEAIRKIDIAGKEAVKKIEGKKAASDIPELSGEIKQTTPMVDYVKSFFKDTKQGTSSLSIQCQNGELKVKALHTLPYTVKVDGIDIYQQGAVTFKNSTKNLRILFPIQNGTKKKNRNTSIPLRIE
jgi:HSP20 family molecular chaperone IbpA